MGKLTLKVFLFLLTCHVLAQHQDSPNQPDKNIAKHVIPFLNTLNSGTREAIRDFIVEKMPSDISSNPQILSDYASYLHSIHFAHGKLKLHGYRDYQPALPENEVVAILYSELSESWLALTLIGDGTVEMLDISPSRWPSNVAKPKKKSDAESVAALTALISKLHKAEVFSGSVIVADKKRIMLQESRGKASKRFNVPVTDKTRYHLASLSKMFTGVMIGKLVEQGKVKFSDPVSQYLDEKWLPKKLADQMTIEQLLNHSAGLDNSLQQQMMEKNFSRSMYTKLKDYAQFTQKAQLLFKPGSNQQYSNTGLVLAGAIIEKVTGQNFQSAIKQHLFKPLKMQQTDFVDLRQPANAVAVGYERDARFSSGWQNNTYAAGLNIIGMPEGDAVSTAGDLHKFAMAWLNGQLFSKEISQKVTSFYSSPVFPDVVGHSGGHLGIDTHLSINLKSGLVSIVLSNHTNGGSAIAAKIRREFE